MPLTFGSLFAGIGGFDLGFERAGMVCKWQVEKDPFCQKVLAKHWPDVERFEDVREVGKHNLEPVDVICGGFPCQPHSVAGQRKGAADDRDLWPEYRRIVAELQPAYVVGENVPGIRSTILDQVLFDLEHFGYACQAFDIPAAAFNAHHIRRRIFILAYSKSIRCSDGKFGESNKSSEGKSKLFYEQSRGDWNRTQSLQSHHCSIKLPLANWNENPSDKLRVVDGVPGGVDRLRSLGNAVVPQVAEFIAILLIRAHNNGMHATPTAAPLIEIDAA